MSDLNLSEKTGEKGLTTERDLLLIYSEQIRQRARELQYGSLEVRFTVAKGTIKHARLIRQEEVLRPF